jgi:hypothetical protein
MSVCMIGLTLTLWLVAMLVCWAFVYGATRV